MIDAELFARLAQPFDPSEVRWKPQTVSGARAMVIAYVDARVIQDRLDEVVGGPNWKDHYIPLGEGNVVCQLSVRYREEWITKEDVGGQSEQPDEGDRCKASFSDALKRAAVKFGIGRYLYRLPKQWVDYDPQKKRITRTPTLPPEALPRDHQARSAPSTPQPTRPALPADGTELQRRLHAYDAALAKQGVCAPGELVKYVVERGTREGFPAVLAEWAGGQIACAVELTKGFESERRVATPA